MSPRERRSLLIILLVALALRLALWWIAPREQLISDEPEYLAAATWLGQGRGFSFYAEWPWLRPPLYLIFLAPFVRLFGLNLGPIRLVQIVISLAVPALTYLLGRTIFGRRVAFLAGLLSALWLPLALLPHLVLAENLFLPLLLGGVWSLVRFQKDGERRRLLLGGGLLGLATLTKGMTIGFLGLAGLWVIWQSVAGRGADRELAERGGLWAKVRRALLHGALLGGAALLLIVPWSGYNWLRYGRPILVDTTGGYNFWLGTQGGQFEHLRQVHQHLLDLPDPAARQAYAYRQGLEAIAEDPGGFLGGRITELGQLLRINYSADERLVDGFVLGQVSIPHLLSLFFLEDTLYVVLVPLAIYGLLVRRGERGRGLVLLWLGYNLLLALGFFAISRFRLPLLPFVAIYAAWVLVRTLWPSPNKPPVVDALFSKTWAFAGRLIAAGIVVTIFWIVVLPSYLGLYPASAGATGLGIQGRRAATHIAAAQSAIATNNLERARAEIEQALAYRPDGQHPVPTAVVALAQWQRARGDIAAALETLEGQDWYQAIVLRGDILRSQGDLEQARAQFSKREVDARNPTTWAWEHLQPPPSGAIDLGGDLDLGLIDEFHLGEREQTLTYRWSGPEARLRFPAMGTGGPATLYLRLRSWRPAGTGATTVRVIVNGVEVAHVQAPAEWDTVTIPLPATPPGDDVVATLRTNAFLAGPQDLLETGKLRLLGVMVDRAELK